MARVEALPWRVPLADVVVSEEDLAAVADVYRSGWLSQGCLTQELSGLYDLAGGRRVR